MTGDAARGARRPDDGPGHGPTKPARGEHAGSTGGTQRTEEHPPGDGPVTGARAILDERPGHGRRVACTPVNFRAVIFDLGGVVFPSPMAVFRDYERRHGLSHRFLSEVVVAGGDDGAWSRFERGELTTESFVLAFEAECSDAGGAVSVADLLAAIRTGAGPNPAMVAAIHAIRTRGLRTAALTNNWPDAGGDAHAHGVAAARQAGLAELFDVVVESAVEGIRKPDPRIYALVCDRVGATPTEAVFLDDLGVNLKPARAMGMTTIKVVEPEAAVTELEQVLGFPLGS